MNRRKLATIFREEAETARRLGGTQIPPGENSISLQWELVADRLDPENSKYRDYPFKEIGFDLEPRKNLIIAASILTGFAVVLGVVFILGGRAF